MKLLNVGCGGQRPQDECWYNLDNLREQLPLGTPERTNLDAEPRYFECNLMNQTIPFVDGCFDGVLLQHVLEHFDCHGAAGLLRKCRRVLKPEGMLIASVPDAEYFITQYANDCKARAVELFGEPIHDDGFEMFFDYALFRYDHKQLLDKTSMRALFLRAGFLPSKIIDGTASCAIALHPVGLEMIRQLSRRQFSVEMSGFK